MFVLVPALFRLSLAVGFVGLLTFALFRFLQAWSSWRKFVASVDRLPGPRGNFLFGNALQLMVPRKALYRTFMDMMSEYADRPVARIWLMQHCRVLFHHAEAAEALLSPTLNLEKTSLYKLFHPWLGLGLLTSSGDKWHRRRRMLTPSFHFAILDDFMDVFNEQALGLVSNLGEHCDDGEPFDAYSYLSLCTLDIICETAMRKKVNAQKCSDSEYVTAVNEMAEILNVRTFRPWLLIDRLFERTRAGKLYRKYLDVAKGFTTDVIADRIREHKMATPAETADAPQEEEGEVYGRKKRRAFLDTLLTYSKNGFNLSIEDIREEVDTFMFEGHDSSAAGLSWILLLLGNHLDVQRKVHEELDAIFGDSERFVTTRDLAELKYLECTIKESFRLFPPIPLYGRKVTSDIHIGGDQVVPVGADAVINAYVLHRDPRNFPDPEKFDPDRFTPENCARRHPFAYLPFSAGPRNCIGQRFALMEEKVILAHLMRRFQVKATQRREEVGMLSELVLRPADGLWITLSNRLKTHA